MNRNLKLSDRPLFAPTRVSGAAVPTSGDAINYVFNPPAAPCYVSVDNADVAVKIRVNSFAPNAAKVGTYGWTTEAPTNSAGGEAADALYDFILRANTQDEVDVSNGGAHVIYTLSVFVDSGGVAASIADIQVRGDVA